MRGTLEYKEDAAPYQQKITWDFGSSGYSSTLYIKNEVLAEYGDGATQDVRTQVCGSPATACDAETLSQGRPLLYRNTDGTDVSKRHSVSSGSETISTRGTCDCYSVPTPALYSQSEIVTVRVCIDSSNLICRAYFGDGTIWDFTQMADIGNPDFSTPASLCPTPSCTANVDIMLVIDESGSIDASEFGLWSTFNSRVVGLYQLVGEGVNPNSGARIGVTKYSTFARLVLPLDNTRNNIVNRIQTRTFPGGSTSTAAAMNVGRQALINGNRDGVTMVMIILTDGFCTCTRTDIENQALANTDAGILTIAIGVSDAELDELNAISSCSSGCTPERAYYVSDFNALSPLLLSLSAQTCSVLTRAQTCLCDGFCGCGGACVCPTTCDDSNQCTVDTCVASTGRCFNDVNPCDDGNECTGTACSQENGCTYPEVTCDDGDACTEDSCHQEYGCLYAPKNCDDSNPCTLDNCDPGLGCVHENISCNLCYVDGFGTPGCDPGLDPGCILLDCGYAPCFQKFCDPVNGGCVSQPVTCNSGSDLCISGVCNNQTNSCQFTRRSCNDNNLCTRDSCVSATGQCSNVEIGCNDFDVCTVDTCDPVLGCIYTPINCTANDTFCSVGSCVPSIGCVFQPRDCATVMREQGLLGDCHTVNCSETTRIGSKVIDGVLVDGVVLDAGCYTELIDAFDPSSCVTDASGEVTCSKKIEQDPCGICGGDGSSCGWKKIVVAVGIGAGAIAGIVIAAVVVCAIVGAVGGKKGYDAWMRNRNNLQGAVSSPIYTDSGLTGTNPLHEK